MRKYRRRHTFPARAATFFLLGAILSLAACAHRPPASAPRTSAWHFPWHRAAATAPVPVNELTVQSEVTQAASVKQYWVRNTLLVDLTALTGSGMLTLLPNAVNGWPARLQFVVRPGSFPQLEIKGDQRVVFPVPAAAADGASRVLSLSPSVYSDTTQLLTVSWY